MVRQILLGPEKAAPTTAPYVATRTTLQYPTAEQALEVRKLHPINAMAVHPDGIWTWISSGYKLIHVTPLLLYHSRQHQS